jgi:hypothetical protein
MISCTVIRNILLYSVIDILNSQWLEKIEFQWCNISKMSTEAEIDMTGWLSPLRLLRYEGTRDSTELERDHLPSSHLEHCWNRLILLLFFSTTFITMCRLLLYKGKQPIQLAHVNNLSH